MTKDFFFIKEVDCGALHQALLAASFLVSGVSYDSGNNQTTVMLEDTETKDPTSVVNAYVYVPYVPPDYPTLYTNASSVVQNALTQYNTAAANYLVDSSAYSTTDVLAYTNALATWTTAAPPTNLATAIVKLNAQEQQITTLAQGIQDLYKMCQDNASANQANKNASSAIVSVVTVLAQRVNILEE